MYDAQEYRRQYYLAHKKEENDKRRINRQRQRKMKGKLVVDNLEKFIYKAF